MTKSRHYIDFEWAEISFNLWRLRDEEYHKLRQSSLPIKEDSLFIMRLFLMERDNPDRLTLPKAFLALERLFGKNSDAFDHWKGSFCFPLLLMLEKSQGNFFYMLRVYDHRGSLQMGLYRVLENGIDDYDIYVYREPFELEFSREEINQFICYFHGYLNGFSGTIDQLFLSPFLKCIDSNLILYGYREGDLFEEDFESEEEYQQAIAAFETVYGSRKSEDASREIQLLLQKITDD
jgi:hypothetical protein